jgi:hypothetical protein
MNVTRLVSRLSRIGSLLLLAGFGASCGGTDATRLGDSTPATGDSGAGQGGALSHLIGRHP